MPDLLKELFNKIESLKGKKLVILLVVLFVLFTIIGLFIGYFTSGGLNENENSNPNTVENSVVRPEKIYLEGKIVYVNPELYPLDEISYKLTDSSGMDMVLLKSKDQKLSIVEGLTVRVSGKMEKLKDGKTDVMIVEEVIIKNATN